MKCRRINQFLTDTLTMPIPGDRDPGGVVRRIIAGQIRPEDVPDVPPRVVRVFLSSVGEGKLGF